MILKSYLVLMTPLLTLMACDSSAVTGNSESSDTAAVAGKTFHNIATIMPEQDCPTKLYGSNLVSAQVIHPSAKLCHYSDWSDLKPGV